VSTDPTLSEQPVIALTLPGPSGARQNAICLDTATAMASIAILQNGNVRGELTWHMGSRGTGTLAGKLRTLAQDAGYDLAATNLIAVCTGPGSFNGIRTAMATALGLATGLGAPIYGISALDLLAFQHAERAPAQRVVLAAGKGLFYSALFATRGGRWRRTSPYAVASLETLVEESPARCIWCGILEDGDVEHLQLLLGGAHRWIHPVQNVRRAAFLLPLALSLAMAGVPGTPATVQPLYLRRPAITQPRAALPAQRPTAEPG
jgi:tRNA threonylcarbamoyladenosine biosynthesis protein TsaB